MKTFGVNRRQYAKNARKKEEEMTKHILDIDKIRSEKIKYLIASSSGRGSCKHLNILVDLKDNAISYEVNNAVTDELEKAIGLYNALP